MTDRLLIVGDVHLGKGLSLGKNLGAGSLNSRVIDHFNLLEWILEEAEKRNVNVLVLTGDIFEDAKPDYRIYQMFLQFLRQCQNQNLEVHLVLGNHELKRSGNNFHSPLEIVSNEEWPNVYYHKDISAIEKEGFSITFMPFRDRRSLQCETHDEAIKFLKNSLDYQSSDLLDENYKIVVGHLALDKAIFVGDEVDDYSNELHCPYDIFENYDYVWMGHVHKPQILQKAPHVAHVGSLDLSDFGEAEYQKVIIFFDPISDEKFVEIPVPSRQLRKIKLEISSDILDFSSYLRSRFEEEEKRKTLKSCILRLEIFSSTEITEELRTFLKNLCTEYSVFHLTPLIEKGIYSEVEIEKSEENGSEFQFIDQKTAIGLFVNKLNLNEESKKRFLELASQVVDRVKTKKRFENC